MISHFSIDATGSCRVSSHSWLAKLDSFEVDTEGFAAPWWADVAIERVGTADGRPLPEAYAEEYSRLFDALSELEADDVVTVEAIQSARRLLRRSMFAGAIAPRLSWHGGDAVVFFWTADKTTSFFTVTEDVFSFLKECDGVISGRQDDIPFAAWDYLFHVPNGVH